ncbi:MAG: hypothetical protein IJJ21_07785 [Firmicutes bacterium]|nr:hypothetical protein [Bacillota bacterium]
MGTGNIKMKAIYEPVQPLEDDVYAYIRGLAGNEIGFSVLDEATEHPDFSNCGMFWLKKKDFMKFFRVSKTCGLQSWGY